MKRPVGKPPLPIDWKVVDESFEAGCTGIETAAALGVHKDTLARNIEEKFGVNMSTYASKCRAKGYQCLKKAQMEVAIGQKNPNMLIWLGKNHLGQSDSPMNVSVSAEALKDLNSFFGQLQSVQKSLEKDKAKISDHDESQR